MANRCATLSILATTALLFSSACGTNQCEDGVDNDGDGIIDAQDPGCAFNGDREFPEPPACNDGVDNDGDGLIDAQDPGCEGAVDDDEINDPIAACKDGLDNDADGLIDFPLDPGCTLSLDDDESDSCPDGADCPHCANGDDDDGDGDSDYPDDIGCTSASDDDEFNADPNVCGGTVPVSLLPESGVVEGVMQAGANNLISLDCGGNGTEVVFQLTTEANGPLVMTTDFPETTTDTVLYLRSDCRMPATEVGCNDDLGGNTSSRLEIASLPAGTYFLVIDSNGTPGNYKLQVGANLPINDCPQSQDVVDINATQMVGTTTGATDVFDLPCGFLGGGDRIYRLRSPGQLATLNVNTTGSSTDVVLGARQSTCGGTSIGCNDGDTGPGDILNFTNLAAGTYFFVVEPYFSSGSFVLNVSGTIVAGQPCDPIAEAAGFLTCTAGNSCQGTAGAETCQPDA